MEGTALFSLPEGMLVDEIQITENGLVVEVRATSSTSCCPLCSERSSSIHCHYRRVLRDVLCAGRRVQLFLTMRKFSCRNPLCQRKVFLLRFLPISRAIGLCGKRGAFPRTPSTSRGSGEVRIQHK